MKLHAPLQAAKSSVANLASQRRRKPLGAENADPLQRLADQSGQVGLLQRLQAGADGHVQRMGPSVQRVAPEDEEPLQGKFRTAQLEVAAEEEEPLQGRFETVQAAGLEEEEPVQGKFETAQLDAPEEEEEPLQGRFETAQAAGLEEEEPLQGKFECVTGSSEAVHRKVDPTTEVNGVPVNDDPALEHEADVMGAKAVQFVPEEEEPLQGKFGAVAQKTEAQPNQTGLSDNLKAGVENLSGMSMDSVRVHYNSSKPAQLNALAYAQGTDIHVGPGQEKHLPHEAWHVVQQAQSRVNPTMQMKAGVLTTDNKVFEHKADVMGRLALQRYGCGGAHSLPLPDGTLQLTKEGATVGVLGGAAGGASIGAYAGSLGFSLGPLGVLTTGVGALVGGVIGAVAGGIIGHEVTEPTDLAKDGTNTAISSDKESRLVRNALRAATNVNAPGVGNRPWSHTSGDYPGGSKTFHHITPKSGLKNIADGFWKVFSLADNAMLELSELSNAASDLRASLVGNSVQANFYWRKGIGFVGVECGRRIDDPGSSPEPKKPSTMDQGAWNAVSVWEKALEDLGTETQDAEKGNLDGLQAAIVEATAATDAINNSNEFMTNKRKNVDWKAIPPGKWGAQEKVYRLK